MSRIQACIRFVDDDDDEISSQALTLLRRGCWSCGIVTA